MDGTLKGATLLHQLPGVWCELAMMAVACHGRKFESNWKKAPSEDEVEINARTE